jgi:hypothetical protein
MTDTRITNSAAVAFDMQAAGHKAERIIAAAKAARDSRRAADARYRSALLALADTAHKAGTSHRGFAKAGMPGVFAALAARGRFMNSRGLR